MILRFVAIGIILVVGAIKSEPQGFGVEELYSVMQFRVEGLVPGRVV